MEFLVSLIGSKNIKAFAQHKALRVKGLIRINSKIICCYKSQIIFHQFKNLQIFTVTFSHCFQIQPCFPVLCPDQISIGAVATSAIIIGVHKHLRIIAVAVAVNHDRVRIIILIPVCRIGNFLLCTVSIQIHQADFIFCDRNRPLIRIFLILLSDQLRIFCKGQAYGLLS